MAEINKLLEERGSIHGEATEQFGVAQSLKYLMRTSPNWDDLPDLHREALEMIGLKIVEFWLEILMKWIIGMILQAMRK